MNRASARLHRQPAILTAGAAAFSGRWPSSSKRVGKSERRYFAVKPPGQWTNMACHGRIIRFHPACILFDILPVWDQCLLEFPLFCQRFGLHSSVGDFFLGIVQFSASSAGGASTSGCATATPGGRSRSGAAIRGSPPAAGYRSRPQPHRFSVVLQFGKSIQAISKEE